MELEVLNNVAGRIEWDADAAKSAITAVIAPYRDLAVTDDNVKDMEKAQKELASMRRKIDKFRKDTKKQAEAPIKEFEMEVYNVLDIIAEAENPLADQLKKYEMQRVSDAGKKVNALAKEISEEIGLREEFFIQFATDGSWLNRTAKKADVVKGVTAELQRLLQLQNIKDEHDRLIEVNRNQVKLLCETMSEKYSLNTAITIDDCPANICEAAPEELQDIVRDIAQKRAEVEQRMMEAAAAMNTPTEPEPVKEVPAPAEEPKNMLHTVTMRLVNVTDERLECLRTHSKIGGMDYEIVEVR